MHARSLASGQTRSPWTRGAGATVPSRVVAVPYRVARHLCRCKIFSCNLGEVCGTVFCTRRPYQASLLL